MHISINVLFLEMVQLTFSSQMDDKASSIISSSFTALPVGCYRLVMLFLVSCSGVFVGVKTYVGLRQTKQRQLLDYAMIHVLCFNAQRLAVHSSALSLP